MTDTTSRLCATALLHYQPGFILTRGLRPFPTFLSWQELAWLVLVARTHNTHLSPIVTSSTVEWPSSVEPSCSRDLQLEADWFAFSQKPECPGSELG